MYWPHDPNHPVSKVCTRCGEEKPFPEFYLDYQRGKRKQPCKECFRAYRREYYYANRERALEVNARWNEANREHVRARNRRWYWANRDRALENGRRYHAENPEKASESGRSWRQENREERRAYERTARQRNPQKFTVREASRALRKLGLLDLPECCPACGGGPVEIHHPDYADPFNVEGMCHRCHMKWHRNGG